MLGRVDMRNVNVDLRPETGDTVRVPVPPGMQQQFGQQQQFGHQAPAPAQAPAAKKVAVLGPTLRFKGELSAEEDFILEGRIEGSINHTQSVTIGTEGSCAGNIHARRITIDGTVEGDLHATESVVVHETGRVIGNIFSPRVALVDGAYFAGRIDMGEARSAAINEKRGARSGAQLGVPLSSAETERMLATQSAANS